MINRIRQFVTNYRLQKLLPCIIAGDNSPIYIGEDIGEEFRIIAWPGRGCYINKQYCEPSNITYNHDEIQFLSYNVLSIINRYTPIEIYKQQQLN
jgi:hypothetical protein